MQSPKKILMVAGILAGAVVAGSVIGWLGGRDLGNNLTPAVVTVSPLVEPPPNPPAIVPKPAAPIASMPNQVSSMKPATEGTNWESAVQAILDSDTEDEDQVKRLFALFPNLPEDGQVAVAENLADLVLDENYAPLGRLLKDARLPAAVQDVLMADASSRPDSMQLPLMLDIARNPAHAKAADAKDILETYLDKDYGSDWDQWQQKLKAWLIENPD